MGEDDDEPILKEAEFTAFEKRLFAAIREANKLDAEIDDEYRRLTRAEYDKPGPSENPA